ncbi:atlastin-like isoform X2 [Ceratitis capitata]|uniref:atlastin-like isoform X2 n=1 Tax=Ceratitis capitata TaxID=7213 RepID=UPI0006188C4F|nr:atlastin-like isoform X2 [Ceratitis capitata]
MKGKPVKMISITNEDDTENSRSILKLNEDELLPIFMSDAVKDRYVSVISVAGAFRKGKSFLLDFFLRYMYAKYVHHKLDDGNGWIGEDDEPLTGFSWRSGCKRETTGILIWSDVFLHDYSDGRKVAIILMDTQGTFDSESTMKDCSNIFAFSTMISSVQIFNIQSNIQKDDLQHLQLFTEYGKIAKKDTGKQPFQKLQFLIRDWQHKWEYSYGADGGKQLLDSLIKNRKPLENQQLYESVVKSFNNIDCYLMPHPGFVIEEPDFNGCLKEIRTDFKKALLDFIPKILAPENLIIKEINGIELKATHFFNYIQEYFKVFNTKEFPEPTTIFKATAELNNEIVANTAKEIYEAEMEKYVRPDAPYIEEKELKKIHKEALKKSTDYYENHIILGKESFLKKFYEKIKNSASSNLSQYLQINKGKLALTELRYLKLLNECVTNFNEKGQEILKGSLKEFDQSIEVVKSEIYKQFTKKNGCEEVFQKIRKQLEERIEKSLDDLKNQNRLRWKLAESEINVNYVEAKKLYEELMSASEQSIEGLEETHPDAKEKALEKFRNVPKEGVENVFESFEKRLIEDLESKLNSLKKWCESQQTAFRMELLKLKESYEKDIRNEYEKLLASEELLQKHEEFKKQAVKKFDGIRYDIGMERCFQEVRQELIALIDEKFDYYRTKNEDNLIKFETRCASKKEDAKKAFSDALAGKIGWFDSVEKVKEIYNAARWDALSKFC